MSISATDVRTMIILNRQAFSLETDLDTLGHHVSASSRGE